uniref:Uncharacterized protein n=1 Tax=Arundo donax TaxID=35708 RepID=A0A0A9CHV3_ARUDO
MAQAPLRTDDGEVGPAGGVLEVVMHDAAAPLLRHELLPPPHELRAVLPRHPVLQRRRERGRAQPGARRYADPGAFRKKLMSFSGRSWKEKAALGLVPGEGRGTWSLSETSESTRISRELEIKPRKGRVGERRPEISRNLRGGRRVPRASERFGGSPRRPERLEPEGIQAEQESLHEQPPAAAASALSHRFFSESKRRNSSKGYSKKSRRRRRRTGRTEGAGERFLSGRGLPLRAGPGAEGAAQGRWRRGGREGEGQVGRRRGG